MSTPIDSQAVSTHLIPIPCASARSCSSASACSIATGGRRREPQQRIAPVDVQADVPPCRRRRAAFAGVRNRRAGEIQREVLDRSTTTLVTFGLCRSDGVVDPLAQRAHLERWIGCERRDGLVDHLRLDQRLVALDVDDQVAVERCRDFREPIGAALMRRSTSSARRRRTPTPLRRCVRSSVATMTPLIDRAADARRYTCSIIGRPPMSASALPGSRVD